MRRRDVLIAAAAIGAVMGLPRLRGLFAPEFAFEPIAGLDGFRQIPFGSASGGAGAALVGLTLPGADQHRRHDAIRANPKAALFGTSPAAGLLPVAVFTDYYCPFCPVLSDLITRLEAEGVGISIRFHDLPVLGPNSHAAARAALAAGRQGKYRPVHHHLMRSRLRPGPASLRSLAQRFELDPDQFLRDVQSDWVDSQIARSAAIAAVFGMIGTPAMVVGRTMVIGEITESRLRALIRLEQSEAGLQMV